MSIEYVTHADAKLRQNTRTTYKAPRKALTGGGDPLRRARPEPLALGCA